MDIEAARQFTLRRILFGDMLLNWVLAVVLTFFPGMVDRAVSTEPLLPLGIYRIIGVAFFLFATWQAIVEFRGKLGPAALIFAALMSEVPVVLLSSVLLFVDLSLRPGWRVILWVGNVYMLLLGVWYLFLVRQPARPIPDRAT